MSADLLWSVDGDSVCVGDARHYHARISQGPQAALPVVKKKEPRLPITRLF